MANPKGNPQNLTPFTSETAPKGRTNLGLSVNEWRNVMADYTRADLDAIIADPGAKMAQVMAAQEMLAAGKGNLSAIEQACSFSNHKAPTKNENINHDDSPKTESERAEARDNVLARIRSRVSRPA